MKRLLLLFTLVLSVLLSACSSKNSASKADFSLPNKLLVINKKSLDNKQDISIKETKQALHSILKEKSNDVHLLNSSGFSCVISVEQHAIKFDYKLFLFPVITYWFEYQIAESNNAYMIKFLNFKQFLKTEITQENIQIIHNHFLSLYKTLDKLSFEKQRVFIYVNEFNTLLNKKSVLYRLKNHFSPYKSHNYNNIFLIPFQKQYIPTYIDFLKPNSVHMRSYMPYTFNTKSGADISLYQLQLFEHNLKDIITK